MVTQQGFVHRRKHWINFVQYNKQYHVKILLNSFNVNDHTLGFHPQT